MSRKNTTGKVMKKRKMLSFLGTVGMSVEAGQETAATSLKSQVFLLA